jgi:hypothetical protein
LPDKIFISAGLDAVGSAWVACWRFGKDDPIETQQFAKRPGLKWATARRVRCFSVGDFRNMTEAGMIQVLK